DPDRREVVWLVQRRERYVFLQRRKHFRIDPNRSAVLEPTVHNTVADADQALVTEFLAHERDQVIERTVVTELRALAPRFLAKNLPVAILGDEARRGVKPFGLASRRQLRLALALRE